GYMPQEFPDDSGLSILEATVSALQGGALRQRRDDELRALRTLERLGIGELALRPLSELSGGQRQLAGLAQAVVRECPVLLLDEPVSALDLAYQLHVMDMARALADQGHIVLVVIHDLGLAAQWADKIAILHQGALHDFGPPEQVIS